MSALSLQHLPLLLPHALIWAMAPLAVAARIELAPAPRFTLFLSGLAVSLVPVDGVTLATWLRGCIGDLAIPTIVLLCAGTIGMLMARRLIRPRERLWYVLIFGGAAILLYPMALGTTRFDPYTLGYHPTFLAAVAMLFAGAAIAAQCHLVAGALLASLLAYSAGILESTNLWDYLIDPVLAGYTFTVGTRMALARAVLHMRNAKGDPT